MLYSSLIQSNFHTIFFSFHTALFFRALLNLCNCWWFCLRLLPKSLLLGQMFLTFFTSCLASSSCWFVCKLVIVDQCLECKSVMCNCRVDALFLEVSFNFSLLIVLDFQWKGKGENPCCQFITVHSNNVTVGF